MTEHRTIHDMHAEIWKSVYNVDHNLSQLRTQLRNLWRDESTHHDPVMAHAYCTTQRHLDGNNESLYPQGWSASGDIKTTFFIEYLTKHFEKYPDHLIVIRGVQS